MRSGRLLSYLKKRKINRNGHSLSFVVPLVVTRCSTRCHSLPLPVIRCHSLYHSLSLVVSLVVTRCTTRLSFYKRSCPSVISIKLLCNFIEITLRHGCYPVNLLHIFGTPFTKNTSGQLLV